MRAIATPRTCSPSSRLNLAIRVLLMLRSMATCTPSRSGCTFCCWPATAAASSCDEPLREVLLLTPSDGACCCGGELLLTASCK